MEIKILKPSQIKRLLDEYIIGQEEAKITLSVAVYNHYKRLNQYNFESGVEIQKSNILMLGNSGTGKTLLAQTLAKIVGIPFAIADATSLTKAGYVGDDVENVLLRLIQNANYDISLASMGIVYIDEVDKLSRKSENPSTTSTPDGEAVQHALLKILEGTVARIPPQGGRKHPQQECIEMDTSNILFICGGAFEGLENIIKQRYNKDKNIGFGANIQSKEEHNNEEYLNNVETDDLLKFGFAPEFIGRLPIITSLKSLDKSDLIRILTEPKNALTKQYQKLLEMDDVVLEFDTDALDAIAEKAIARNTGARGLRSILENTMKNIMFMIPDIENAHKVVVTYNSVLEIENPIVYDCNNEIINI